MFYYVEYTTTWFLMKDFYYITLIVFNIYHAIINDGNKHYFKVSIHREEWQ